eukprot:CAMPEP_0177651036 /NCGR_PEP_ID=MMETSP0447-20121125/12298_1 /TAXON_ID=0 /ORGANISM="Stygamoeba regulata, Strain BSH-02190019" /LENGTH=490 /DNA_ID=CAMNT_0019154019 /DNA_START=38 /DNA_END=1511 /DNA_ORIENTATION=+
MTKALLVLVVVALVLCSALVPAQALKLDDGEPHPLDWSRRHRQQVLSEHLRRHPAIAEVAPPTQHFTQNVDHFDFMNTKTFQQRYFVNAAHHKPGGPVFFMLGQEGPSNPLDVMVGLQSELAPRYGAMVVELEHRYYGESSPVPDLSTDNMRYLSTDQALMDFANFRLSSASRQTPRILTGSCGAVRMPVTSTWLKEKYPQLFTAAVGGSSPLLANLEYYEYDQTVAYSLNISSPECLRRAQEGTSQVQAMAQDPSQVANVQKLFNTCTPIQDVTNFMNQVYNPIAYSTQYNESPDYPRNRLCEILTNKSVSAAQALANANLDPSVGGSSGCLQLDMLHGSDGLLNTSNSVNYRKWFWQKCTQFGYFKVAPKENNVVSSLVQLPYFLQGCQEVFGINGMSPDIYRTNNIYGGNTTVQARNVIAPNGFEDPWHTLSMTHILSPSLSPIYYSGAGHCAPYLSPHPNDTPSVKEARRLVRSFLDYILHYYGDE